MANIPPTIRVNAAFPFPAVVQGLAPVVIGKANGIWTVTLNVDVLGVQTPPLTDYSHDFVIVWDAVNKTFFKMPLSAISNQTAGARTQRSVTASPIVVNSTDQVINCAIPTAASCQLPLAATRGGIPLTFKDFGQAGANPITIGVTSPDTIDGASSFVIGGNYQGVTFVPVTDGVHGGWMIQ